MALVIVGEMGDGSGSGKKQLGPGCILKAEQTRFTSRWAGCGGQDEEMSQD